MKEIFDQVSGMCSKMTTRRYSTSFSLGIRLLHKRLHEPIYGIYGFVRFADEIVDSFHDFNRAALLAKFKADTYESIASGISLNPILNSFQRVVNTCQIPGELIDVFFNSMEMDLEQHFYTRSLFNQYVLGSAEAVGLMCLKVFCEGDEAMYERLKEPAMKLGSAFQKINFLRDVKADKQNLGRNYFPDVDLDKFTVADKVKIEKEIQLELKQALIGIKMLPPSSRRGVYLAYKYYLLLFKKIKNAAPQQILNERIRVSNIYKIGIMCKSLVRSGFNML